MRDIVSRMMTPTEIDARLYKQQQQAKLFGLARALRRSQGLSQQEVADMIGVSRSALARWETGSRIPRGEVRDRYARLLVKLVRGKEPPR